MMNRHEREEFTVCTVLTIASQNFTRDVFVKTYRKHKYDFANKVASPESLLDKLALFRGC